MSENSSTCHEGGCACGQVRYRMSGTPIFVHCCHCSICQRQSGSAFAVNAMIETSLVELLCGKLDSIRVPTPSGKGQVIYRCSSCQIAVWSTYGGAGEALRFVRAGTLDNPGRCPPDIHIYTSTRQPWTSQPDDLPAVEQYYSRSAYWSAESQNRLKKLSGQQT